MPKAPEISAILTTHNRAHLLPRVLEGFRAQRLPPDRYELLVIDDGSSDGTAGVLDAYRSKLPMRMVRQNAAGLAAAKNLGAFMSQSPILLFVDDDDVPSPNLLMAHLSGHLQHRERGAVILGHTALAPDIANLPLMRHVTGAGGQLFSQGWMQPGQGLTFREFWGGRSSAKRALLVEFGVFNPIFRFGCEDVELAWRLERRHGISVIYQPAAVTTMIRGLDFDDFCHRSIRQGRSQWAFASLHPNEDVRTYCEIDQGLAAWSATATDFAAILRHVRGLDLMMQMRGPRAPPLTAQSQVELDAAYREAFFLCRAKGIADAANLPAPARPMEVAAVGRLGLLDRPASITTFLPA
jgi:GT2 family glycosyltransferase